MAPPTEEDALSGNNIAGGVISSLTPKETQMLAVVVSMMGDVPNINFEEVAPLVGQKYARNARSACKKLFDKLKKNAPPGIVASSSTGTGDESAPTTPKKTPSKPRKVGAKSTPKKATSAPKGKAVKAEMNDEAGAIESHADEDKKLDFDDE